MLSAFRSIITRFRYPAVGTRLMRIAVGLLMVATGLAALLLLLWLGQRRMMYFPFLDDVSREAKSLRG